MLAESYPIIKFSTANNEFTRASIFSRIVLLLIGFSSGYRWPYRPSSTSASTDNLAALRVAVAAFIH